MDSEVKQDQTIIVKTDEGNKDGQNKCPKCGSTDISTNIKTGKLRCHFCRYEFEPVITSGMVQDISHLQGNVMGSGTQDIVANTNDVLTFKCSSCGAEVIVDTASATQARCHWCRNFLSVNEQIPNGSIPDVILPFNISKKDAQNEIEKFVKKRKFFANPKFKKEFSTDNIMGVYFPYMLVDVNAHINFVGQGEHEIRRYTRKSGDHERTYYDAELYDVSRKFDIAITDLSIESNSDRLKTDSKEKTNNILNSIMPFDTENCVKYDANYLRGFTSERRDTNVDDLRNIVNIQSKDIARFAANDSLKYYDRGVCWKTEEIDVKGQQWEAAYLPVWLYSYQQVKGKKKLLHYVAVNARTKETMGSVPIHMPKLMSISILIEFICSLFTFFLDWENDWVFLIGGIIFFIIMYSKYRNSGARHTYEKETKRDISNMIQSDTYVKTERGLSQSSIVGANNHAVYGQVKTNKFLSNMSGQSISEELVKTVTDSVPFGREIRKKLDNDNEKKINN